MKNKAFTLAEIMIVLMIMGFLIIVMIKNIRLDEYSQKELIANGQKAIQFVEQGFTQIKAQEAENCPTHTFMHKVGGTYEYTLFSSGGNYASASDVISMLENHLKTESTGFQFCSNTSYCSNTEIVGAKMPGDIYIGVEVLMSSTSTTPTDCPQYYMPGETTPSPAPTVFNKSTGNFETDKCWGKVYIDTNGTKGPDALGQDVFVFGLNSQGVAR